MISTRRPKKKRSFGWDSFLNALQNTIAQCLYAIVGGIVVLLVLFLVAITPERYNLHVGDIAPVTITASKDVVDEVSTSRQREEAARQVEPSYLFKENLASEVSQNLTLLLAQVNRIQQYGQAILERYAPGKPNAQRQYAFTTAEIDYARSQLTLIALADFQLDTLLRTDNQQMSEMNENVTSAVENIMNTSIREGHTNESIQYLQQIIGYKTDIDLLQNVVTPILRKAIQPNMIIDQEATAKLQEEARLSVEAVVYKQGQNIILARERVTLNQLEMLRSLGLLDNESVDINMYTGGALLVLLAVSVLWIVIYLFEPSLIQSPKKVSITMLVLCLSFAMCLLLQMVHVYIAPVLLGTMMLTGLLGASAGFSIGISLSLLAGAIIAGGDNTYSTEMLNLLLTTLVSSLIAVVVIRKKPYRQQVLLCGVITALSNMIMMLTIGLMTNNSMREVLNNTLWSAGGALISSVMCVGLDPLIESFFNLATPSKLLELSNPNHPLLRRLLLEAPGTYHHSIIVANLSEAAAEAVNASPLLARASAYFHDIGKLKRPLYFMENQMGENPHEHTNPHVSAAIVIAHVRDGLIMAQQSHLPQEIQDVIIEHHGDTAVMFFYNKALLNAADRPVDRTDFRYDGRHPHTKISAIVMLADTVEAAVRSMPDPTPDAIKEFIEQLVRGKLEDGQLSDAPITLSDIDKICLAFSTVLKGIFHERIEYPMIAPSAAVSSQRLLTPLESPVEEQELRHVKDELMPSIAAHIQDPVQMDSSGEDIQISLQLQADSIPPTMDSEPSRNGSIGDNANDH